MPPPSSTLRRPRFRRVDSSSPLPDELLDSSPSRPRTKRRKVVEPIDTDIITSQDQSNAVIATLAMPDGDQAPVVATQWANEKNFQQNTNGITAYAKVSGCNWTYYVRDLVIRIGRPPENRPSTAGSQTPPALKPEDTVHIDLGPSKWVSRNHAIISYDDSEGEHDWRIHVMGRNGVKIDDETYKKDSTVVLWSGSVLEIGGTQMMFVLPNKPPVIASSILRRARLREYIIDEEVPLIFTPSEPTLESPSPIEKLATASALVQGALPARLPSETRSRSNTQPQMPGSSAATAPTFQRGVMMEMTEDVDYSQDSMKEVKPPYSYALMIAQAILSSETEQLTLASIYQFIMDKYSFYRHSNMGWQNSIRHNLSLNKAFRKIPRRIDEPGKGMKWELLPEHREEYIKKLRRPVKTSRQGPSQPASPKGGPPKTIQPSQTIAPLEDAQNVDQGESSRSITPPPMPAYRVQPLEAYTPDRGSRLPALRSADKTLVDTPRPPLRHAADGFSIQTGVGPTTADDSNIPSPTHRSAFDDDENPVLSAVTPAPRRQHPRLAPPSTGRGQLPSSFLPTSSPAPFWKYVQFGSTPAKPNDFSPLKDLQSSSPPPVMAKPDGGPKRNSIRELGSPLKDRSGLFHLGGARNLQPSSALPVAAEKDDDDDDDDGGGLGDFSGIDLSRGFEKIGKFHVNGRVTARDGWA